MNVGGYQKRSLVFLLLLPLLMACTDAIPDSEDMEGFGKILTPKPTGVQITSITQSYSITGTCDEATTLMEISFDGGAYQDVTGVMAGGSDVDFTDGTFSINIAIANVNLPTLSMPTPSSHTIDIRTTNDKGKMAESQTTLNYVNTAPVINHTCGTTATQDVAYSCATNGYVDPNTGQSFSWSMEAGPTTCPSASVNSVSGNLAMTANDDDIGLLGGSCVIAFKVNDGYDDSPLGAVTISITNVQPTLTIGNQTITEDDALAEIVNAAANEEGMGVYSLDNGGTTPPKCSDNGTLTVEPNNGSVSFQPSTNYDQVCNVKVVFDDQNTANNTVSDEFSVTVSPVNDAPVVSHTPPCSGSATEDVLYSCSTTSVIDPDAGDTQTWDLAGSTTCAWASIVPGTGVISGTPNDDQVTDPGTCQIDFKSNDGTTDSNVVSYTVNVVNVAPSISAITDSMVLKNSGFNEVRNDGAVESIDEGHGTYSIVAATAPDCQSNGTVLIGVNEGAVTFQPNMGYSGTCNVKVEFNDGNSVSNLATDEFSIEVKSIKTTTNIASGNYANCSILGSGAVKCWGESDEGMLGNGVNSLFGNEPGEMGDNLSPLSLGTALVPSFIASGGEQTCVNFTNNTIKCWGDGFAGGLGNGGTADIGDDIAEMGDSLAFTDLGTGLTAVEFSIGSSHGCARFNDGKVKCWGYNNSGQVGIETTETYIGDSVVDMGDNLPFVNLGTGRTATKIAVGNSFSCALLDNNDLKCWGDGFYGNLGTGNTNDIGKTVGDMGDNLNPINLGTGRTATDISAGMGHVCALLDDNNVKCWGYNGVGSLGLGDTNYRGDNPGEMGDNLPNVDLGLGRTATKVFAGQYHSCALLDNNDLKCWGYNYFGSLGLGATGYRGDGANEMGDNLPPVDLGDGKTAVDVVGGYAHTCALLNDNTIKCFGYNSSGQLGHEDIINIGDGAGEMGNSLSPTNLGAGRTVSQVTAGIYHTCALLDNNDVKCWGKSEQGEVGLGKPSRIGNQPGEMGSNLAAVPLGTGIVASLIRSGRYHVCAIINGNNSKCWGEGGWGRLGGENSLDKGIDISDMGDNLNTLDFNGLTVKDFALGSDFSCAHLSDDSVRCFGYANYGQLGHEGTTSWGDSANEMGVNLPATNLGSGRTVKSVSAGYQHACAILDNNDLKCWGRNNYGQLGQGDISNRGDGGPEMGDNLNPIDLGTGRTAIHISSGNYHNCAILDDMSIKCWGYNNGGILGLGDQIYRGDGGGEMGDNLPVVDLGPGAIPIGLWSGPYHNCAQLQDDTVRCWGQGSFGRLGIGASTNIGDAGGEMGAGMTVLDVGSGRTVDSMSMGLYHSCARLDNGDVKCWGYNNVGQLGLGDTASRGDSGGEMGNSLPVVDLTP